MNEVVFFGLIVMFLIRLIGLGTSFNFFYDLRKKSYYYLIIGWFFAIFGNIFPLLLDFIENTFLLELVLMLNALLISFSMILVVNGIFLDFLKIKFLYLLLSLLIITLTAILFFLINYKISITFSVVIMNSTILIAFIIPLFKLRQFKEFIGRSIRWYYITVGLLISFVPISFFIFIQGYGYGLYFTDNIPFIILNYIIGIITHFLLIVFLIHLEYTISIKQQNQLKDKYSHNLGNIMQVIYSSADLFKRVAKVENVNEKNLDLIERKCKEASKLIKEIRNL